jgi:hypothetical protein
MNRQNNLKIILTTVIVLVISAITVFTVVNWAEIVKKFQGAAAKNEGFEKHERNTVQPNNVDTSTNTSVVDSSKDISAVQDESKILHHPTESNTKSFSKFDEPLNPETKDATPIGLDEPPVKAKDSKVIKPKTKGDYPLLADGQFDSPLTPTPEKSIKMNKSKKYFHAKKHHRKHRHIRNGALKGRGLEKRVTFLEKKFGVKKTAGKKQTSLANRIYRLEKLITKKKK